MNCGKDKAILECGHTWGRDLTGTTLDALDMVFRLFEAFFVSFFAMESCFQRPFSSICCIFNSTKHGGGPNDFENIPNSFLSKNKEKVF